MQNIHILLCNICKRRFIFYRGITMNDSMLTNKPHRYTLLALGFATALMTVAAVLALLAWV